SWGGASLALGQDLAKPGDVSYWNARQRISVDEEKFRVFKEESRAAGRGRPSPHEFAQSRKPSIESEGATRCPKLQARLFRQGRSGINMKIHEYQAKEILRKYGVAVPRGEMVESPEAAQSAARKLFESGATGVV